MKPGWKDAFERLAPPPGGLQGLRERLAEKERERRAVWPIRFAAAAAVVAIAAIVLWTYLPTERRVPDVEGSRPVEGPSSVVTAPAAILTDNPLLVAAGIVSAPTAAVTLREPAVEDAALLRVDIADPDVAFYLVASVLPE